MVKWALASIPALLLLSDEEYKRQTELIDSMLAGARELETESLIAQAELDRLLSFAEWMTWNADRVWLEAPMADRVRIQKAFFPEGVVAFEKVLGTRPTASFLKEFMPPGVELMTLMSTASPAALAELYGVVGTPPNASFLKETSSPCEELSSMASPEGVEPSLPP